MLSRRGVALLITRRESGATRVQSSWRRYQAYKELRRRLAGTTKQLLVPTPWRLRAGTRRVRNGTFEVRGLPPATRDRTLHTMKEARLTAALVIQRHTRQYLRYSSVERKMKRRANANLLVKNGDGQPKTPSMHSYVI